MPGDHALPSVLRFQPGGRAGPMTRIWWPSGMQNTNSRVRHGWSAGGERISKPATRARSWMTSVGTPRSIETRGQPVDGSVRADLVVASIRNHCECDHKELAWLG
jgi:hypothetical protein